MPRLLPPSRSLPRSLPHPACSSFSSSHILSLSLSFKLCPAPKAPAFSGKAYQSPNPACVCRGLWLPRVSPQPHFTVWWWWWECWGTKWRTAWCGWGDGRGIFSRSCRQFIMFLKSHLEIQTQFMLQGSISGWKPLLSPRKRDPLLQTDPSWTLFSAQRASVSFLSLAGLRVFSDCLPPFLLGLQEGLGEGPGWVSGLTCAASLVCRLWASACVVCSQGVEARAGKGRDLSLTRAHRGKRSRGEWWA